MSVLLLVRAKRAALQSVRVQVGDLADECAIQLRRARRDQMPVVHLFPDWPPGVPQLPGCEPVKAEYVVSDFPALFDVVLRAQKEAKAEAPRTLVASGICDAASYRELLEMTRAQRTLLELAPMAFKLLRSAPAMARRSEC